MKLDYAKPLIMLDGKPFVDDKSQPLTLGGLIILACSVNTEGDHALPPVDKYKVGEIAVCVHKGLDLVAEQIATVKERVAKVATSPVLVYMAHQLLEGKKL